MQRLDALLEKIDNIGDDETENYLGLIDTQPESNQEKANLSDLESDIPEEDEEVHSIHENDENENDEERGSEAQTSPEKPPSLIAEKRKVSRSVKEKTPKPRRPTQNLEKELVANQIMDQQLRRQVGEVTPHVLKTATVESFLEELDSESEIEPRTLSDVNLISSPPPMRRLKSFVAGALDEDSDLEIIPETKKNRIEPPVREMLRLHGTKTKGERDMAKWKSHLAQIQTEQIKNHYDQLRDELKQAGVDLDELEKAKMAVGGTESWLEKEMENAKQLEVEEGSSHSEIELGDDEAEDDFVDFRAMRRKILSDDDDEEEEEEKEDSIKPTAKERPVEKVGQIEPALRTGTQYVEPVSESMLAQMLDEDEDIQNEEADDNGDDDTQESDHDTPDDNVVIGEIAGEAMAFEAPDVSDVKGTLSERLKEVRKRYLANKNKQRQYIEQQKRAQHLLEVEAEESDEEGGVVQHHDNEEAMEQDVELEELVDRSKVKQNAFDVKRKFAEEEKMRDSRLLNKVVQGVNGGGFQRRNVNGTAAFLDGDDDILSRDDPITAAIKEAAERKRKHMLENNQQAAKLASNAKASAFFSSISEDLVARPGARPICSFEESLKYLRTVDCHSVERTEEEYRAAPTTTFADPIKVTVRKTSRNIQSRKNTDAQGTYVSRIASIDFNTKSTEILQSLGKPKQQKKKFVAAPAQQHSGKKRRVENTKPVNTVLGSRMWH